MAKSLAVLLATLSFWGPFDLQAEAPIAPRRTLGSFEKDAPNFGAPEIGCLPSCRTDDGRFLTLASGPALRSLSTDELRVQVVAKPGGGTFRLAFFDGDSDGGDQGHWDLPGGSYEFALFADTDQDGFGDLVAMPALLSSELPDNEWFNLQVPRMAEAEAPSGNFFYVLRVRNLTPGETSLNSFKVLADGFLSLPAGQPFGLFPSLANLADAEILYPNFPDTQPTTFDGTLQLFLAISESQSELVIWDGDLDRGSFDGTFLDTDDLSTPASPFVPTWATELALPEGVAVGQPGTTGSPADDSDGDGAGLFLIRSPSISYSVTLPNSSTFLNNNPSGNLEWEHFRITTQPGGLAPYDYATDDLPAGIYRLDILGMDLQNSSFWRFDHPVICQQMNGLPCDVLPAAARKLPPTSSHKTRIE